MFSRTQRVSAVIASALLVVNQLRVLRPQKMTGDTVAAVSSKSSQHSLCSLNQLYNGSWDSHTYDKPHYIPTTAGKRCRGVDFNGPWETWEWNVRDEDCEFARFHRDTFCSLSRKKTILILGDSISVDHFLSLVHLLGSRQALPRARDKHALMDKTVCNGTVRLISQRDFFLQHIAANVIRYKPDIIVLNRGAHYVADDELMNDMGKRIIPEVRAWRESCPECLFVWRTTVPGHPNCTHYTKPSLNRTAMEEAIQASLSMYAGYHWQEFDHQNQLILDAWNKSGIQHLVMDGYYFNLLRPDAHPSGHDCLHTCAPGDEIYSELLLHIMRQHYDEEVEVYF